MVYDERVDFDEISNSRKGGIISGTKQRLKSLREYYEDPNYCKECGEIIEAIDQDMNDLKEQEYCSHSCSAKNHDLGVNGPDPKPAICEGCGEEFEKPKSPSGQRYNVKYCSNKCRERNREKRVGERTKKAMEDKYDHMADSRTQIRRHGRRQVEDMDKTKDCLICGYDFYVELCHIKPISEFDDNALVKEINSENNMVYLCPNHHKEFDYGKINKDDLNRG